MTHPSGSQVLRRAEAVLETQVDGEIVLMSMEEGYCYGLDAIGSEVWLALRSPATLEQLQSMCRDRYAGDPVIIDNDVAELLSKLRAERLVEAVQIGTITSR